MAVRRGPASAFWNQMAVWRAGDRDQRGHEVDEIVDRSAQLVEGSPRHRHAM